MKIIKTTIVFFLLLITTSVVAQEEIAIIPKPAHTVVKEGKFQFSSNTKFIVKGDAQKDIATALITKFGMAAGWKPQITNKKPKNNYIEFKVDKNLNREAYKLDVSSKSIVIIAKESAGFIYALETVRQLLPTAIESKKTIANVNWSIPNVTITDEPRFQWRGLMLDLSRHFFDKSYIKATIDRLAMLKMNVLHLHLVDDQGWRMEIKKYPKLTEIGAWRVDQENVIWNARLTVNPDEKGTYGGFLTQEELKEIVKYAATKNIQIIPEIEMPAHVSSAIAAYPELACFNQRIGVPSGGVWPITDIYCAGKENTFAFLQDVIDEVVAIFPSKYIHIGGDEATKTNWETCPHCKKRMQEEGLKNVHELQSYFVKRMEKYINSKGKRVIGWDEILEGGLAPDATVMSWRGTEGGIEASKQGHDVIMTPESHCYFNIYQGPQNEEPLAFGGFIPLTKVYHFDPVVDQMTPEQAKHILGAQANLWAEYIESTQESEYMIFPRLGAMAEVLWSPKAARNWNDFTTRLPSLLVRFDYLGINYSKSAYLVSAASKANLGKKQIKVALKNEFPNADIRYVLDNKNLDNQAIKYTDSIAVTGTTILKASLFKEDKPVGKVFTDSIQFHKAVGNQLIFKTPYHQNYKADGPLGLVNIIRGSKNFHDGQWQAWLVDDMEVVIDLDKSQSIHQVTLGALENQGSGIYFPTEIKAFISTDGKTYKEVGKIIRPFAINSNSELKDFKISFENTNARFVKVIATNLKKSPKGESSFMFFDEILID
ncbi:beta-hexosaminidase [Flavobacterium palustre]|uniref:beta-N-acetylhexosaminidase n=1 Tax=Flavobacterium palustre TaxID=1476463 RepID=A0ABQ1HLL3_9FLAO|nr:family 20 glycosylhydrolase [Flavobacterium palustre]GGA82473.1 beta-hexosaminidase [Flavobacterium palustre]